MTNHWNDIGNADVILALGGNPAENHPAAFHWITVAKDRGAKLLSVDPRFTRTSSKADFYAPIRSGTDVAFVGGMIKYVLDDIENNPQNYNLRGKLIITSGRGSPPTVPEDINYLPFTVLQHAVETVHDKFYLTKAIFNSRKIERNEK